MADESEDTGVPVRVPPGFLNPEDDTTVGGDGWPYAGIGNSQLPPDLRAIGAEKRQELFPSN